MFTTVTNESGMRGYYTRALHSTAYLCLPVSYNRAFDVLNVSDIGLIPSREGGVPVGVLLVLPNSPFPLHPSPFREVIITENVMRD